MNCYYYVHTGHRIGLDRFRRAATIIRLLDEDITLLTSDYRIASSAKEFGIKRSVGIDVVGAIPHIADINDKIIFDSDEINEDSIEDMVSYFSKFLRVSDNLEESKHPKESLLNPYLKEDGVCNEIVVDDKYFNKYSKNIKISFFFGDDDYEKVIEQNLEFFDGFNMDLLLGFYYFVGYEDSLEKAFSNIYEYEDYDEVICGSEILVTSSAQAVLESLASGCKPIYIQRDDAIKDFQKYFKELNVPVIDGFNKEKLSSIISNIDNIKYGKIEHNSNTLKTFLKSSLNL
ncbi:MAG: hypothetical protein U9N42_03185 [Campylobacterota bacterium]|nr:hypothetical protein [Campylobacterota bacterium]